MICPYLTAVLPGLVPGEAPELTPEEFDALAAEHLPASACAKLVSKATPIRRAMARFLDYLAYRVAQIRAGRLNVDADFPEPEEFYGEIDYELARLSAALPTEREALTDALLWRFLDDREIGHEMDLEHLTVYRMRLEILKKYAGRDAEAARKNFEQALESLSAEYLQ